MAGGDALAQETADVLARLIRFKTVNPPGNERECQQWLAGYLRDPGADPGSYYAASGPVGLSSSCLRASTD